MNYTSEQARLIIDQIDYEAATNAPPKPDYYSDENYKTLQAYGAFYGKLFGLLQGYFTTEESMRGYLDRAYARLLTGAPASSPDPGDTSSNTPGAGY